MALSCSLIRQTFLVPGAQLPISGSPRPLGVHHSHRQETLGRQWLPASSPSPWLSQQFHRPLIAELTPPPALSPHTIRFGHIPVSFQHELDKIHVSAQLLQRVGLSFMSLSLLFIMKWGLFFDSKIPICTESSFSTTQIQCPITHHWLSAMFPESAYSAIMVQSFSQSQSPFMTMGNLISTFLQFQNCNPVCETVLLSRSLLWELCSSYSPNYLEMNRQSCFVAITKKNSVCQLCAVKK